MAFQVAWSFENEEGSFLASDLGWTIDNTSTPVYVDVDSTDTYTYTGSPTKYALCLYSGNRAYPPAPFQPVAHKGCWAAPVKAKTAPASTVTIGGVALFHDGVGFGVDTYIRIGSVNTFELWVASQFKGSSQVLDMSVWHYLCLKSDMTTTTYSGEMWIDGVQEATGTRTGMTVQTSSQFYIAGCATGAGTRADAATRFGGLSYWDDTADSAQTPMYYTTVNPNEDLSNVGTWASTEATDWQSVEGALNTSTNTTEASPTSGDRVNLGTKGGTGGPPATGGTDDLTDHLGTNPSSIAGISLHTWSTGESINAKAVLGHEADASEITGTNVTISAADTTYAHVGSGTKPGGGAWTGASQPELNYEID
jgi:hypothetical protein